MCKEKLGNVCEDYPITSLLKHRPKNVSEPKTVLKRANEGKGLGKRERERVGERERERERGEGERKRAV